MLSKSAHIRRPAQSHVANCGLVSGRISDIIPCTSILLRHKVPGTRGDPPQLFIRPSASVGQAIQAPGRGPPRHGREHKKSDAVDPLCLPSSRESAESLGLDKVAVFAELLLRWGLVAEGTGQQFD